MYNFPSKQYRTEAIGSIDFGAFFLEIIDREQTHHFFINHVPHSEKCIILGTGAINKSKVSIPYYDRMSWYNLFTVSSIFYFDSTLFFDNVNLGWLYGTNDRWYMEEVANIIIKLLANMNISPENSICVGSSGGGFTSCVLATLLKSKAIVFNPQLICSNWSKPHIDRLKDGVLHKDEQLLEERLNLNLIIEKFNYLPSLHIFYNVVAKEDIDNQLIPFIKKLSEKYSVMEIKDRIRFDFYTNVKGHNGMIDNDETIKLIEQDLMITNDAKVINQTISSFEYQKDDLSLSSMLLKIKKLYSFK